MTYKRSYFVNCGVGKHLFFFNTHAFNADRHDNSVLVHSFSPSMPDSFNSSGRTHTTATLKDFFFKSIRFKIVVLEKENDSKLNPFHVEDHSAQLSAPYIHIRSSKASLITGINHKPEELPAQLQGGSALSVQAITFLVQSPYLYHSLQMHKPSETYSAAGCSSGRSCVCSFSTHHRVHINSVQEPNKNVTVKASSNGNTSINFHLSKQLPVSINYSNSQLTVAAAK